MNIERNILIAFLLNLGFSIFEFFGGIFTGSVAIHSDAVHDLGDALAIGVSWFLEHKSRRQADSTYTYGYARFSVLGSVFTCGILLLGSVGVIVSAVGRLMNPVPIHYDGMILFAVVGVAVNLTAAFVTREGENPCCDSTAHLINAVNQSNKERFQQDEGTKMYAQVLQLKTSEEIKKYLLEVLLEENPSEQYWRNLSELVSLLLDNTLFEKELPLLFDKSMPIPLKAKVKHFIDICNEQDYDYHMAQYYYHNEEEEWND